MNIVVTGASKGLGEELCRLLFAKGHHVWGIARSFKEGLEKQGQGTLRRSQCNIADPASVDTWMKAMASTEFVPDIVILNAAIQHDDLGEDFDTEAAKENIDINLCGSLTCIGSFLPLFQKNNAGQFLIMTSTTKYRPSVRSAGYAASKAGLSMAIRSLRLRYGTKTIRFREICLGPMQSTLWEGKPSPLVPSPNVIAQQIVSSLSSRRDTLHFPRISTTLLRLTRWMPDRFFQTVSTRLLHK